MKKVFLQILFVSIGIFIFTYFFLSLFLYGLNSEFLYYIKKSSLDYINKNLIVVEIDDLTYSKLGFPLERKDYAPFLENLSKSGPSVVGFDILFLDKGKDKAQDLIFSKALKDAGNVVLGFDIKNDYEALMPYVSFFQNAFGVGYFQPFVNINTKKVSSIEPFKELSINGKKGYFDSFAFAILRGYFNDLFVKNDKEIASNIGDREYNFFGKKIPIVKSSSQYKNYNEFIINYSDPSLFQRESFYNIYTGNFEKDKFKDKIVLVGFTAEGVKDDFYVPSMGIIKGVYIHANVINNILNENFIVYFNKNLELFLSFLFIFLLMYINVSYLKVVNLRWISLGAVFLFIFIFFLYTIFFILSYKFLGVYLLPNFPFQFLVVLFLSFFASSVLKYVNEDKNKRLLSKALSEYVSSDIVKEILTSSGQVKLDGERKKISMFFSDIAGFTTISERMEPEALVSFLKEYLGSMSDIIMDNRGFINKYEGDAIMALWGVFDNDENFGVISSCKSALIQQKELAVLNESFEKSGIGNIKVRMGIHVGDAIIGNIGSEGRKMEFTALGDSVNLASRLEGVNKYYDTYICVSQDVYELGKEIFVFRFLDKIKVKGKNNAIDIYELVGFKGEISDLKIQIINNFQSAIRDYFNKEFESAKDKFLSLGEMGDGPSKIFARRCEIYLNVGVSEDWDGVWTMKDK